MRPLSQPIRNQVGEHHAELEMLDGQAFERLYGQEQRLERGVGDHVCRSRLACDERHLADHIARREAPEAMGGAVRVAQRR